LAKLCGKCGAGLSDSGVLCGACGASQIEPTQTSVPSSPYSRSFGSAAVASVAVPNGGLQPNVAASLSYLAGFVTGIIFILIEPGKSDRFVRFHAFQSIFFNVVWVAFWIVWALAGLFLGTVTRDLFFLLELPGNLLLTVGGFCMWASLMYSAYQGKTFTIPVIGSFAAKQAGLQI